MTGDQRNEFEGGEAHFEARRRLMKAGLVAVPFLVTLHSIPLRAQAQGSLGIYQYDGGGGGRTAPTDEPIPGGSSRPSLLEPR